MEKMNLAGYLGYATGALVLIALSGVTAYLVHLSNDKWFALGIGFLACSILYRLAGARFK